MAFELMEEEPENLALTIGKEGLRHTARTASDIGTQAIGFPGDVFSLINEFIARPATKLATGEEGVPYEETYLGKAIPTTETHRKRLGKGTEGYLSPQNDVEKFGTSVVDDATLILNPIKIATKGVKLGTNIFKSLAKSLGANLAGETAKQVSGSEGAGNATKAGALFVLSMLDQKSAAKHIGELYRTAEQNLPSNATTNANVLSKELKSLEHSITKGRPKGNLSPPEKFVVDQIEKVNNLIENGQISIEQAIAQKKSLHKELGTLYKEVPKHGDQKTVKNLAKKISASLNNTIENYGQKNPKFYKSYKQADEAFGTIAKSNFISNWVENNVVQHPLTTGLLHLFGPVATTAATAIVPYQATKLTYRIAKSPTLAKIYGNTVKAAIKEDAPAFNKYLNDLDKKIQEEEGKDRFEFID